MFIFSNGPLHFLEIKAGEWTWDWDPILRGLDFRFDTVFYVDMFIQSWRLKLNLIKDSLFD